MMKLLCRFYKTDTGLITFDDINIEEYDVHDFRKKIGAIFQDFAKFNLTLRENTALSDIKNMENDNAVNAALKKSNLDDFDSLDMLLGNEFEGGRDVSGGQWQKIAIARVFSVILIF